MITRKRIGDILLEAGIITEAQLQAALEDQKTSGQKIGAILVRQRALTENALLECLGKQLMIERYAPDKYPLDPTLASLVPHALALRHQLVPLRRQSTMLLVAMPNPSDIDALEAVERQTKLSVEPVICTETELGQLTSGVYGATGAFDELMGSIETPEFPSVADDESVHEVQADSLADMAEGAPAVRMVNWLLSQGIHLRASDIHLSPEKNRVQLRFRIDGRLKEMPSPPRSLHLSIVSRIKLLAHMDIALSRVPQDGRFAVRIHERDFNIRASSVPTVHGENIVLRLLDVQGGPRSLDDLDLSHECRTVVEQAMRRPWGMILVCGPTGSGKTTTLYTLLKNLTQPHMNVMTLEDPAEYQLPQIRQVQINHRAGMTFAQGLRALLRQDPDVIMVGEIRDLETAQIAVQAALTGHLVLSTLHTNDAVSAVVRLMDMGIPSFLVGSVITMVMSQRLVRRTCSECAAEAAPPPEDIRDWLGIDADTSGAYRRGKGCNLCLESGYLGRLGLYELLAVDDTLRAAISGGTRGGNLTDLARSRGLLHDLRADAARRVVEGATTPEEAVSALMI